MVFSSMQHIYIYSTSTCYWLIIIELHALQNFNIGLLCCLFLIHSFQGNWSLQNDKMSISLILNFIPFGHWWMCCHSKMANSIFSTHFIYFYQMCPCLEFVELLIRIVFFHRPWLFSGSHLFWKPYISWTMNLLINSCLLKPEIIPMPTLHCHKILTIQQGKPC